jgi:hypothetical protein
MELDREDVPAELQHVHIAVLKVNNVTICRSKVWYLVCRVQVVHVLLKRDILPSLSSNPIQLYAGAYYYQS